MVQQIRSNRLLPRVDKECDVSFYNDQKGARMRGMASRDKKYEGEVTSKGQREESEEQRRQKAACEPGTSEIRPDDPEGVMRKVKDVDYIHKSKSKVQETVTRTFPRKILK